MLRHVSDDGNDHDGDEELGEVRRVCERSERSDERFADEGGDQRFEPEHGDGSPGPAGGRGQHSGSGRLTLVTGAADGERDSDVAAGGARVGAGLIRPLHEVDGVRAAHVGRGER